MPPIKRFGREEILNVTLKIVQKEGFESINARKLASVLGSSVQPIFHYFKNMDELHKAIYEKMYEKYKEYMTPNPAKEKSYKQLGLGYIRYAKDYPEFFKAIFMQHTQLNATSFIMADQVGDAVIKAGQELTGFTYELQEKFHVKVWIFTHGIACLLATKTVSMSDEEVASLLESTVREMATGFKMEEENL